ncbi:hypothetical protein VCR17J2_620080 [Vibrio coralliirubri]|nr:hypothetical protein VCR17J2_620080 [Vibrio coralliirubri]
MKDSGIFLTFLLAFLLDLFGFLLLEFGIITPPKSFFLSFFLSYLLVVDYLLLSEGIHFVLRLTELTLFLT